MQQGLRLTAGKILHRTQDDEVGYTRGGFGPSRHYFGIVMSTMVRLVGKHQLIVLRSILPPAVLVLLLLPTNSRAYSVFSHETLVDAAWESAIVPLIRKRFPSATPEEIRDAHAFAYGGSVIQDLGYYPRGSHEYSDLVHYVRSGDFVQALIGDAKDVREYAFGLGALAHYCADKEGHRLAVNLAVPVLYPSLAKKYGKVVTYEDNPVAHAKTEFGFDVIEVAKQRFPPDSYRNLIGFRIAERSLRQAFEETYSIPLESRFAGFDRAVGSFRFTVHSLIPKAVRVAWALKKDEIQRDAPGITKKKFLVSLSRASYELEWGKNYQRPGWGTRLLAFLIRLLPRIGPLRVLSLRMPTPETERMFEASFNSALQDYRSLLSNLGKDKLRVTNLNLDTGAITPAGRYSMADTAYARLAIQLASRSAEPISGPLRSDILEHFNETTSRAPQRRDKLDRTKIDWKRIPQALEALKSVRNLGPVKPVGGARP